MRTARGLRFLALTVSLCLMPTGADAHEPVFARKGMVVAQEPLAADVGVNVLKSGGNAVDAAVAFGFVLAVTHPLAGIFGGGGFRLILLAGGRTTFIDSREKAPQQATRNIYLDKDGKLTRDSLLGWRAAGVPGTVRGFELAQKEYGQKSWTDLLQPALELASNGFPVSHALMQSLRGSADSLSQFPDSKLVFLKAGAFYDWNEIFRQPDLARTLERIAHQGAKDFYEGETARIIAHEMERTPAWSPLPISATTRQ